jgi:hypothetical protein
MMGPLGEVDYVEVQVARPKTKSTGMCALCAVLCF